VAELHPPRKGLLRGTLRRRGIYILPNLFTTGVLFGGFYAIVQAMNTRYEHAAVAIFVAMVLDGLDGRVARLTRTQSEFGAEYDSLADVVAFGAAPALVMYEWALRPLGRIGWIVAFAYCAATALRLARFNVMHDVVDKRFFQGLPSPAAAALVAGFVWIVDDLNLQRTEWLYVVACVVTLFAGITMVTSVPFYSFKDINFRRSVPFWAVLVIVLGLIVVSTYPALVLFGLFVAYSVSGYAVWLWNLRKRRTGFSGPPA
jgi:CDP-diacylglycerol--serine O-phosphatidyltransferase